MPEQDNPKKTPIYDSLSDENKLIIAHKVEKDRLIEIKKGMEFARTNPKEWTANAREGIAQIVSKDQEILKSLKKEFIQDITNKGLIEISGGQHFTDNTPPQTVGSNNNYSIRNSI